MKALTTNGLTKLIQLIKSTFIPNTDVETTTEMDVVTATAVNIDNTPTQSSANLVTSGGVYDAIAASVSSDVEWATYGTTTHQQILDWVAAGKSVFVKRVIADTTFIYKLDSCTSSSAVFSSLMDFGAGTTVYVVSVTSSNAWGQGTYKDQAQIPAGTAGNVITYTGTAGSIGSATLATVATSGSFADLQNKPTTLAGYGITDGANTDLSNLTTTGKNISNWSSNVSNCITEIPQDIKVELNNGTLTLKAGSKVYVPNGAGVFDVVTIASDLSTTDTGFPAFVFYDVDNQSIRVRDITNSGTSDPQTPGTAYYDTQNNIINYYTWGGVKSQASFPLCIITGKNIGGVDTTVSIDQVFNGFGYIGSTVFALPGVKALIPNGRNADGSLKSIEYTIPSVKTHTANVNQLGRYLIGNNGNIYWIALESEYYEQTTMPSGFPAADKYALWYNPDTNIILRSWNNEPWTKCSWTTFARVNGSSNKITSLKPKTVFRAADYNDTEYIAHQAMPSDRYVDLTLGASGSTYVAPADGYFSVHGGSTANGGYVEFVSDTKAEFGTSSSAQNGVVLRICLTVSKGDLIKLWYSNVSFAHFRFYYANGEA